MPVMTRKWTFVLGLALCLSVPGPALPQSGVEIPAGQTGGVAMPGAEKIVLLVRNSLITLNDALQTGNFTVLRDMAAPGFREANSAAKLSQIFASLGAQNIDLSAVAVIVPQLSQAPGLDPEKSMLHLKGYFPGQPVQINFELLYQAVNGSWRLFGISVQPGTPQDAAPRAEASGSTAAKKKN
jgi:hypothetical protein